MLNKMHDCKNICLCASCDRIVRNCAECKESVDNTDKCLNGGIKTCKIIKNICESEEI